MSWHHYHWLCGRPETLPANNISDSSTTQQHQWQLSSNNFPTSPFTGLTKIGEALYVVREIDIFYAVGLGKLQPNEPVSNELVLTRHTHIYITARTEYFDILNHSECDRRMVGWTDNL